MALSTWINHDQPVSLGELPVGGIHELQTKLCDLGLLDPIIRGTTEKAFGPVAKSDGSPGSGTRAALKEYCRLVNKAEWYIEGGVTRQVLTLLDRSFPDSFLKSDLVVRSGDDLQTQIAKRVLNYMQKKGYWIALSPHAYNIVYVEGMNANGTLNDDAPNMWNDRRMVISFDNGTPVMLVNDQATTEPGRFYTVYPEKLKQKGVARIAFGQYKAWRMGKHQGWQPALVQSAPLRFYRDVNKDGRRKYQGVSDPIVVEEGNGVNQHTTGSGQTPNFVNKYSAGCLVGRRSLWHESFLEIIAKDFRYQYYTGYKFISTVIPADEL